MAEVQAYDQVNGDLIYNGTRIFLGIINGYLTYGYTLFPVKRVRIYTNNSSFSVNIVDSDFLGYEFNDFESKKFFSKKEGTYAYDFGLSPGDRQYYENTKSIGYPYDFAKKYEAIENFDIFKNKQKVVNNLINFRLSKYLKYTIGLEFETCIGIIPEDICFRDGLIPLRDGSISGNEYSTVVLNGNEGLNLLKQQISTLNEYTEFNNACSLHIHFGGFPLEPDKIYSLYSLCYILQKNLSKYLPKYTFNTSKWKPTKKDYCKLIPKLCSFIEFYHYFVGVRYFGDLTQPHPNDVERKRKWQINTRYYWINFINAICYNVNKTLEFRMLRPTYNFHKILFWIYIFNAILMYAEKYNVNIDSQLTILDVLNDIYPKDICVELLSDLSVLKIILSEQEAAGDFIGERFDIEDLLLNPNSLI